MENEKSAGMVAFGCHSEPDFRVKNLCVPVKHRSFASLRMTQNPGIPRHLKN